MDVILIMFGFTKKLRINNKEPPPYLKLKLQNKSAIVDKFSVRCNSNGSSVYPENMNVVFELHGTAAGTPYYIADFSFDPDLDLNEELDNDCYN